MKTRNVALVALLMVLTGLGTAIGVRHFTPVTHGPTKYVYVEVVPSPTASEIIEEDDPRWDCHTMGGKTC